MKPMLIWTVLAAHGVVAAVLAMRWLRKRRRRYATDDVAPFHAVRAAARTGDIILFHKTTRTGPLDALELDVLSPLLFNRNEFRHSGIVVRENGQLFVLECADTMHSGHSAATYLTGGTGIRRVELETLLAAYTRDNGAPHFGIKHISNELDVSRVYATVAAYGPIDYLKMQRSVAVFVSRFALPAAWHRRLVDKYRQQMMCSEFVHSLLNRCGVLRDYPSKVFVPYYIEDAERFRALELVPYSDIVRFRFPGER